MTIVLVFADFIILRAGAITFGRVSNGEMRKVRGGVGIIMDLGCHLIPRGT